MQIVIDISEKDYNRLKRKDDFDDMFLNYYEKAIVHGTPLSKGHGRLIDEQQIIDRFKPIEKFKHWYVGTDGLFNVLSDAPTIIETDKESEEKE